MTVSWPEDRNTPADFEEIVKPLIAVAREAYTLTPRNEGTDLPYDGFGRDPYDADPAWNNFSAESLAYDEERDRDPLAVIIGLAVQIGVEQGQRIARSASGGDHRSHI